MRQTYTCASFPQHIHMCYVGSMYYNVIMKPFLLLQSRPEDVASDNEYDGFLEATGLAPAELQRIRVEAAPLPALRLEDYSGVIIGGGPFNASDPEEEKSSNQKRVEADFARLLDEAVEKDFPVFGACYGVGTLGAHQGAVINRKFGEKAGPVAITLTEEGRNDPLLQGVPESFQAIVGHKEACEILPQNAVHLASSPTCPVQMFRVKNNLYATQFHPELDFESLRVRLMIYNNHGYFEPGETDTIIDAAKAADLSYAPVILKNFIQQYQK